MNDQKYSRQIPQESLRTSESMAAEQTVGFFDRSAIAVNSQEQLATSNNIWRPFVCHPKTDATRLNLPLRKATTEDPVISPGALPMAGSSNVYGPAKIGERNFRSRKEIELMVEDKL